MSIIDNETEDRSDNQQNQRSCNNGTLDLLFAHIKTIPNLFRNTLAIES